MKKITLIAAPWIFKKEIEFVSQNLGLAYLASYLQKQGDYEITFIDPLIEGLTISTILHTKYDDVLRWGLSCEEIIKRIPSDAQLIGVSAPFTDSRFVVNPMIKAIKKKFPEIPVALGGVYPSTLPQESINLSGADIAVRGEGEISFSQIALGTSWNKIKGIIFRDKEGNFIDTGPGEIVKNIDDIPMLLSDDIRPMDKYVQWSPRGNKSDRTFSVVSSRGCPFNCRFCSIHPVYGWQWRAFSPGRVLNEIKIAVDKFNINHIEFEDDNLTLKKDRAMKMFDGIQKMRKRNGEKIFWSAPNGVMINSLDRELIFKMKESGCELIYLPVESGDEKILKLMNKALWSTHLTKTLEVAKFCKEADIQASVFIIVGYPGEDEESFNKTVEFCKKLRETGVEAITPLVAAPYPGTYLYDLCKKNGWLVRKDMENILIYQRYSHFLPEFVNINTPWCSAQRAYERHKEIMDMFPTLHNVRKFHKGKVLRGRELQKI